MKTDDHTVFDLDYIWKSINSWIVINAAVQK